MRQAMTKWLSRHQITFSADAANSICSSLGLDGEKVDDCLGLCYQLEKGDINEADFTGGLSLLTGKKPEEVMEVLKGIEIENQGKLIAKQLGNNIIYNGPQMSNGEFQFHIFTDVAVTGTTFAAKTLEEAKANLIEKRKTFGAKPPIFPEG